MAKIFEFKICLNSKKFDLKNYFEKGKRKREKGKLAAREKGGEKVSSQEKRRTATMIQHGQPRAAVVTAAVGLAW